MLFHFQNMVNILFFLLCNISLSLSIFVKREEIEGKRTQLSFVLSVCLSLCDDSRLLLLFICKVVFFLFLSFISKITYSNFLNNFSLHSWFDCNCFLKVNSTHFLTSSLSHSSPFLRLLNYFFLLWII